VKKETTDKLRLKIGFEKEPEQEVEVTAFAFDRRGNLLDQGPVKKGRIDLDVNPEQARTARLFFAPTPPEDRLQQGITIKSMQTMNAYEASWRYENRIIELNPIPEILTPFWLWRKCRVRGKVVRKVEIAGEMQHLPVCHARVHICEVDAVFRVISVLPERELFRLRDDLVTELERPFPRPLPDPPFRYDAAVIDPSPENLATMSRARLDEIQQVQQANLELKSREGNTTIARKAKALTPNLEMALKSQSAGSVRGALQDLVGTIQPLLCLWPYFWPFLECDEIRVLETDENGLFDTNIWYHAFGDKPDLYFWVEFMIGGVWQTVYKPSKHCHTWWNYSCGTMVTLPITDPRVPWCGDPNTLPGKTTAVLTIGNNVSLANIQKTGAKRGQVDDQTSFYEDAPFGSILEPHIWFGDDLAAHNITHYLWSYRREGTTPWYPIDSQVVRHYGEIQGNTLTFKTVTLGPDPAITSDVRFKIQAKQVDDMVPPTPGVTRSWAPEVDARSNTASAFFRSHLLNGGDPVAAAGKYELMLQFFHANGTVAKNIDFKIPTNKAPFGNNNPIMINAPIDYLIKDGGGDVVAFKMVLHIDNNPCEAVIYDAKVGANAAGACGFIPYSLDTNPVELKFKAAHENDFAYFTFRVIKGSYGLVYGSSSRVGLSPVNAEDKSNILKGTFVESAGIYESTPQAGILLGTCGDAAFAETLDVDAMATDGWSRLHYLDRNGVPKAFALKHTP
jgi:hypothetical protein